MNKKAMSVYLWGVGISVVVVAVAIVLLFALSVGISEPPALPDEDLSTFSDDDVNNGGGDTRVAPNTPNVPSSSGGSSGSSGSGDSGGSGSGNNNGGADVIVKGEGDWGERSLTPGNFDESSAPSMPALNANKWFIVGILLIGLFVFVMILLGMDKKKSGKKSIGKKSLKRK